MAKKSLKIPYPVVCIEWDDHFSTMGWVSPKELGQKARAISIGLLVKQNKLNYYLSTTCMEGGTVCDPISIMKTAVTSFTNLTEEGETKKPYKTKKDADYNTLD
jgi:hypothetical protein